MQHRDFGLPGNSTSQSIATNGSYKILRADILQTTVNITSGNSTFLASQEKFNVNTEGINSGALPVECSANWVSLFITYPAVVPLLCTDPEVNATLIQREVWPEYGGFYLFVELKYDPCAQSLSLCRVFAPWLTSDIDGSGASLGVWTVGGPS